MRCEYISGTHDGGGVLQLASRIKDPTAQGLGGRFRLQRALRSFDMQMQHRPVQLRTSKTGSFAIWRTLSQVAVTGLSGELGVQIRNTPTGFSGLGQGPAHKGLGL